MNDGRWMQNGGRPNGGVRMGDARMMRVSRDQRLRR